MPQFQIFGLTFNLYGLILGAAILAAYGASLWLTKERKIETKIIENLFWWVIIGGIIGARLYHVIDRWEEVYGLDPKSSFFIWHGGLGIWGAIGGGVAGLAAGMRVTRTRIDWRSLSDLVFFGLPLGQAIGRWGNFFNGEIMGKNGEPLFLYESGLNLVLFAVLAIGRNRWKKKLAGFYLIGYGLIRLFLETFRQSADQWLVGGISMATVLSAIAVMTGAVLVRRRRI